MKHVKKLLSLALALALCLGLALPVCAAASDFEITGTTLKKYKGPGGNVVIPSGITSISDYAFRDNKTITSVVIPKGVTSIGGSAFSGCAALSSVTLPEGLTNIDGYAFDGCSSLTSLVLPNGIINIGESAFRGCSSLTSVTVPGSVTTIGGHAFSNCTSMVRVNILGPTTVSGYAFNGTSSLKTIAFYDANAILNVAAIDSCPSLTTVYLPSKLTKIEGSQFASCSALHELYLPATVTSISDFVGSGTPLNNIYFEGTEEQWKSISRGFFLSTNFKQATVHYNCEMPVPEPVFIDVPDGQWYTESVSWAVGLDITNGTGKGSFSPDKTCTQEQILTFLYRAAQGEGHTAAAGDITLAVNWAREKGMIDGSFVGATPCTRAAAVHFIWQAFGSPNASGSSFNDVPAGADYAASVSWAVQQGITAGTGSGNFSPNATCNRGQIVTFLYRAYS